MADVILFGALLTCQKCQNGKFVFQNEFYACTGNMSEYAKCSNKLREPKRISVQIPSAMSAPEDRTFLRLVYKLGTRAITISQQNAVDVYAHFSLFSPIEFIILLSNALFFLTDQLKHAVVRFGVCHCWKTTKN